MPNLILHIGPGKCGSTSIQRFFSARRSPCDQKVSFELLDPFSIAEWNQSSADAKNLQALESLLDGCLIDSDAVIMSHEMLFKSPVAIRNICGLAAKRFADIRIIGYCRRQSDFVVSAYSQWLFRSPERARETTDVLLGMDLAPGLFSGLERHLIAAILTDFFSARQLSGQKILDWYSSYREIAQIATAFGAELKVGQLPGRGAGAALLQDFCDKCNLALTNGGRGVGGGVANTSFHPDLVEAMNSAVILGLEVPGPHDGNAAITNLSGIMPSAAAKDSELVFNLKSYVDAYFLESNRLLCRDFNLKEEYFAAPVDYSKADVLALIRQEERRRLSKPSLVIDRYRLLSAQMAALCLQSVGEKHGGSG